MLQLLVGVKWVSIVLFAIIHILIGLALIYFYGKLPKALTVFASVYLNYEFCLLGNSFNKYVVKLTGDITGVTIMLFSSSSKGWLLK